MKEHRLRNVFVVAWTCAILGVIGPVLVAGSIPVARGQAAMRIGAVNLEKNYAVIDDQIFLIAATTRVTRASGATGSLTDLRKGMRVTIQSRTMPGTHKPTLTHIQIIR